MNRYSYPTYQRPPSPYPIKEGDRVVNYAGNHGTVGMEYVLGSQPDILRFMIAYDNGESSVFRASELRHE